MINELDVLIRIALAIGCGLCIGLERQMTGHIAGIKTNVLISFGSCIFVLFTFLSGATDTTRIAAQVVTGVGFLCSSVIMKNGMTVNGLNTSATIWCTAGIGVLSSLGMWRICIIVTAVLIIANLLFYPIAEKIPVLRTFDDDNEEKIYKLNIRCSIEEVMNVRKFIVNELKDTPFILTGIDIKENDEVPPITTIKATVSYIGKLDNTLLEEIVEKMSENNNILGVTWKLS